MNSTPPLPTIATCSRCERAFGTDLSRMCGSTLCAECLEPALRESLTQMLAPSSTRCPFVSPHTKLQCFKVEGHLDGVAGNNPNIHDCAPRQLVNAPTPQEPRPPEPPKAEAVADVKPDGLAPLRASLKMLRALHAQIGTQIEHVEMHLGLLEEVEPAE